MEDTFEEIRKQIHEIRDICGASELKLADLEERIARRMDEFEKRLVRVENVASSNSLLIEGLVERFNLLESAPKVSPAPGAKGP